MAQATALALVAIWSVGCAVGTGVGIPPLPVAIVFQLLAAVIPAGSSGTMYGPALLSTVGSGGAAVTLSSCQFVSPSGTTPGNVVPQGLQISVGGGGNPGNASQCVLFGTISVGVAPGTYTFTVRAADNSSPPQTDDETYTITISSLQVTVTAAGNATTVVGEPIMVSWTYTTQGTAAVPSQNALVQLVDAATMTVEDSCTAPLGNTNPNGAGNCTLAAGGQTAGMKNVVLTYPDPGGPPDPGFLGGAGGIDAHTVLPADTTTAVASTSTTGGGMSEFQEPVTFTATVTINAPGGPGSMGLTGTVNFVDTTTMLPVTGCTGVALSGTAPGSTATCMVSSLTVGAHNIQATYDSGNTDPNFNSSMGAIAHTVNQALTGTVVTSMSTTGGGMSVFQESVTFTATVSITGNGSTSPVGFSGTVDFFDTTTMLPLSGCTGVALSGPASGSTATCMVSNLAVGAHNVQATYDSGNTDGNFATSMGALAHTVNQAATTTALVSSVNPSDFGNSVTFTATVAAVAPGSTAPIGPTGTIDFVDTTTATNLCPGVAINAAFQAQCMVPPPVLAAGSHNIVATYSSDANFAGSANAPLAQVVNQSTSITTLMSSAPSTAFQEAVTFTATVAAGSGMGTPTGSVTFVDATAMMNLSCGVQMLAGGVAMCTVSDLSVGMHNVRADYGGDTNFSISSSAPLGHTVNQATTTTMLMSSLNPSAFGNNVTFTATIMVNAPGMGAPIPPGGTVTFVDTTLGANVCTGVALAGGLATCMTNALAVGTHNIRADYSGDTNFTASMSGLVAQMVNAGTTATALMSNINPSTFGQLVTFTATVTITGGSGNLTGTVDFVDTTTATNLCIGVALSGVTSGSTATCMVSSLAAGLHDVTANYVGDPNFANTVTGMVTQTVNQSATNTALMSSGSPTNFTQMVTFTATVTAVPPGAGTPTGNVTFVDTTTAMNLSCGVQLLAGGMAMCTVSDLQAGMHNIQATYNGDPNFLVSMSGLVPHTVNPNTSTVLASSSNPSEFQQLITFTATVTDLNTALPVAGIGDVTFTDTSTTTTLCANVPVSAIGQALCNVSNLSVATHNVQATYNGVPAVYSVSLSNVVAQMVTQAATTTLLALTVGTNPSTVGDSLTFTATLLVNGPGSGVPIAPTGTYTFVETTTATTLCLNVPLSAVQDATCTTTALMAGPPTRNIQATYSGDTNFSTSNTSVMQDVNLANATIMVMSSANPSQFQQTVTFTATLTGPSVGSPTPTGTATFFNVTTMTNVTGCVNVAIAAGTATCMTNTLPVGMTDIRADYSGDTNYNPGMSANLTQTVNTATTNTAVTSSASTSVFGQTVTLTATITTPVGGVTPVNPTGTVDFFDNMVAIANCSAVAINASQQATCMVPNAMAAAFSVGMHNITADYTSGDTNFANSSSPIFVQTVNASPTTTAPVANGNVNTVTGEQYTVTVTVSSSGGGMGEPDGDVDIDDGEGNMCNTGALTLGAPGSNMSTGSCMITSRRNGTPGKTINATFNPGGSGNFVTSMGTDAHTVNFATTVTTINDKQVGAVSQNTTVSGEDYDVLFTVTTQAPGMGEPTGTVMVNDDDLTPTDSCMAVLTPGAPGSNMSTGTCTILNSRSQNNATNNLVGNYQGDPDFDISTSVNFPHVVNKGGTGLNGGANIVKSTDPTVVGETYTVTVTVNASIGEGNPTGTVDVDDGQGAMCTTGMLLPGPGPNQSTASCMLTSTTVASNMLNASYAGDADFNGVSASNAHTVNPAATMTTVVTAPTSTGPGATYAANVVVTSVAPGSGEPTGDVDVDDGIGNMCTATLVQGPMGSNMSTGTCNLTSSPAGPFPVMLTITAQYDLANADPNYNSSSGMATHTIDNAMVAAIAFGVGAEGKEQVTVGTGTDPDSIRFPIMGGTPDADGNPRFYACSLASGALPTGVTVALSSVLLSDGITHACTLTGTPAAATAGTYMFAVQVTDAGPDGDITTAGDNVTSPPTAMMTWDVLAAVTITSGLAPGDAVDGRNYGATGTANLTASGGFGMISWSDNGTLATDADCNGVFSLAANGDVTATPATLGMGGGFDGSCNFSAVPSDMPTTTSGVSSDMLSAACTDQANNTGMDCITIQIQPVLAIPAQTAPNALRNNTYFPYNTAPDPNGFLLQVDGGTGTPYTVNVLSGDFTQNVVTMDWEGNMGTACEGLTIDDQTIVDMNGLVRVRTFGSPANANLCATGGAGTFQVEVVDQGSAPTLSCSATLTCPTINLSIRVLDNFLYVADPANDQINVFRVDTTGGAADTEITTTPPPIPTGAGTDPHSIAITPDGSKAFVTLQTTNQFVVINTVTNAIIATTTFATCTGPRGIDIGRAGAALNVAFVGCTNDQIATINTTTNMEGASIAVNAAGASVRYVAVAPNGNTVFASRNDRTGISINATTFTPTEVTVADANGTLRGVAVSADGLRVYFADAANDEVQVRSAADLNTQIDCDAGAGGTQECAMGANSAPEGLTLSLDGSFVFVANNGTDTGGVISESATPSVHANSGFSLGANSEPFGLTTAPGTNRVYFTLFNADALARRNNTPTFGSAGANLSLSGAAASTPQGARAIHIPQ